APSLPLQFARRDAKGSPPDPALRIPDLVASPEYLRERLRHGIARDLRVARERQEHSPDPIAPFPVQALDPVRAGDARRHVIHARHDRVEDRPEREHVPRKGYLPMWCSASWRVLASFRNSPRTAEVTVTEPGFFTPRIVMHRCSASITTNTPRGSRARAIACAVSLARRS